ncbi:MAG: hypothetical protein ABSF65_00070 [Candidatus Bathyarchaeia archaeon]|jgi:hypothetical protein
MLKALVIRVTEKTKEMGSILAIARDAARKRENSPTNPPIRALQFIAELGVFVAIYEAVEENSYEQKSMG